MWRAFTEYGNNRWIDFIDKLLESYNTSVHSSTTFAPNNVTPVNEAIVRANLYPKTVDQRTKTKFKVGDLVRISRKDNVFRKGYAMGWTFETFTVAKVKETKPTTYGLKSFDNEPVSGSFYSEEMQKVDKSNSIYQIERIINNRTRNGAVEYRVKYMGFDHSFNEWVKKSDLYPVHDVEV